MTKSQLKDFLLERYSDGSKHSVYQNIPSFIELKLKLNPKLDNLWRSDIPRWDLLQDFFSENEIQSVADVGANTGYFSFNFANTFPQLSVSAFELNPNHVDFIKKLSDYFEIRNVKGFCDKLTLENASAFPEHDLILYMNIAHHIGHDFNKEVSTKENIQQSIIDIVSQLSKKCKWLVYQMGYNWGGDKTKPIIDLNDDVKKYRWTKEIFDKSGFEIALTAIATRVGDSMEYCDLNIDVSDEALQEQLDELNVSNNSEFFRRPFFVLQSKETGV